MMRFATGLNSTKVTFLWWPVSVTSGSEMLQSGPPSGNSHSYAREQRQGYDHDRQIRRRTNDLLVIERVKVEIAQVAPANQAQQLSVLVTRQHRKLGGHSARCVVSADANRTTTASSREGEVLCVTLNIVLISGRRGNSKTLVYLFGYSSPSPFKDTL